MLIEPIQIPSLRLWAETLVTIAAYIVLYITFLRTSNSRLRFTLLGAMLLLATFSYSFNVGASCMFIYVAAMIPFLITSPLRCVLLFGMESLWTFTESHFLHISVYNWMFTAVLITVVGGSNIFMAQKMRADCKLRLKQEEIEALAAVAERERIARDLHDVLGHTLSVIVLKSELAGRLLDRELALLPPEPNVSFQRARAEIGDVERSARTALGEVREAIGGYRAKGLPAEIDAARQTLAAANVTLLIHGKAGTADLSAAEETVLALALREAVTNIVRHAGASTCHLYLESDNGRHRLRIEDDGQPATLREGNGLRGMRERVESLGGQLSLHSDAGTALLIELPLRSL